VNRIKLAVIFFLVLTTTLLAQRTKVNPARVLLASPQQDVEVGRQVAQDAEKQLTLIRDRDANAYISALGQALAAKTPNPNKFPFTFKIVDDRSINAFALPGGPIYMHRGAIEAADNEAQLAGVLGHEIGHVVLRHGMSQVGKAQLTQGIVGILGGLAGNSTTGQILTQVGAFGAGMTLLRYSRDAETQSDLLGTQILYDSGYNPAAMAQFFEKLAKQHKGSKTEQFFSNHPIPENRVAKVNEEIRRLGPAIRNPKVDSAGFQRVKRTMLALPEPRKPAK
jgi:predicted Zn-dependent protease